MNIERSRKWMVIGLAAGLAGALAPQASRAEENCSSHRQLLEQALPADLKDAARAMIAAQPAAGQLTEAFNPRVIGGVLGDRLRPDKTQCRFGGKKKDTRLIECVWTSRAGSVSMSGANSRLSPGRIGVHTPFWTGTMVILVPFPSSG